jgi:hypothetical protein
MKGYNLFLDDVRSPQDAFNYTKDTDYLKLEWRVARTYDDFVDLIVTGYLESDEFPGLISFDHDLADDHYEHLDAGIPYDDFKEKTGYHCARWLVDFCIEHDVALPLFKVHSMNPTGKENIAKLLTNFARFQQKSN